MVSAWRWLHRRFCGHHNTSSLQERDHNDDTWRMIYWTCHDCGLTRGGRK